MLTLTYALVALSVEQQKVHASLLEQQQKIERLRKSERKPERVELESLLNQFMHLHTNCVTRNFELYVLPALRLADQGNSRALADLDGLSIMCDKALKAVRLRWWQDREYDAAAIEELFNALNAYCGHMLNRLDIEKSQLMPIAQRVISSEEWFDIAAQFISHESERYSRKSFDRKFSPMLSPRAGAGNQAGWAQPAVK